ncbi:pseudouridine synthase [Azonexus sp.]|uniref:pseudouridine synthase n=1 Tax=Azonexus sp. TaxID=1872668 RepID=UPI0035AFD1D7
MTQPDDPWAKWRKPAADDVAVDRKPSAAVAPVDTPKPAAAPEKSAAASAPAKPAAPAEPQENVAPTPPTGTLGVLKTPGGETTGRKRPVRGGALARKPRETPAAPSRQREGGRPEGGRSASAKPRQERQGEWQEKRRPEGGRQEKFGQGRDEQKRDRRPAGENPWARKPASEASRGNAGARPPRPERAERPASPPPAVVASAEAPSGVRLSKVMSERGLCSRREADLWIERGWVFVNGEQVSELGSRIDPDARIEISTEAKKDQAKAVTILLHKPVGYVSGQPEPGCIPAVTLVSAENQLPQSGGPEFKPWMLRGLAPAGRLDVDSTGLLVLTSDGRVAKRLIGEDSEAEKEYLVRVSGQMIKGGLELLRHGLELDGKPLKPAWVKQLNEDQLHFILKEGKKRQIRRMCELVGLKVIGLKRVRIGRIRLGDLPMGQWRFLRDDEAF